MSRVMGCEPVSLEHGQHGTKERAFVIQRLQAAGLLRRRLMAQMHAEIAHMHAEHSTVR
jgi:hypothetical protein